MKHWVSFVSVNKLVFDTLLAFIWKTPKWNVILAKKERAIHRNANISKALILKNVPSTRTHCLACVQGAWYLSCQQSQSKPKWGRNTPSEYMGPLVCHKKMRASLLPNNFASKWWAHCTVLPLSDEGWGGMVYCSLVCPKKVRAPPLPRTESWLPRYTEKYL